MSRSFAIVSFVLILCAVAGVELLRSSCGSSLWEGLRLDIVLNNPEFLMLGLIAVVVIGIVFPLCLANRLKRRKEACTDFTHAFNQYALPARSIEVSQEKPMPRGEMLVADAAVFEVAEIARLFEQQGIRFETRQTVIDNAFHWRFDEGGLGTRMCVIVHRDDVARALPIVERVMNPPTPEEAVAKPPETRPQSAAFRIPRVRIKLNRSKKASVAVRVTR